MNYLVKDLMVPISEYATVSEGATLFEAVMALEEAQLNFDRSKYHHRAILVMDKNNRVVGKLSQLNVLRALEVDTGDKRAKTIAQLHQFGFSPKFVTGLKAEHQFKDHPLTDICKMAAAIQVENVMKAPTPGEYVDEDVSLESVIPKFLHGAHLSLLVTRGEEIVGILRVSDVFAAVFHVMKECRL